MQKKNEASSLRTANFVAHVDRTLRDTERRVTRPRILVAECLANGIGKPWTAYSITEQIKKAGYTIDTVSVYRILKVFVKLQLAKVIVAHFHAAYVAVECGEYYGDITLVHNVLPVVAPVEDKPEIREMAGELSAALEEEYPGCRVTITVSVPNLSPRSIE